MTRDCKGTEREGVGGSWDGGRVQVWFGRRLVRRPDGE